MVLCQYWCCTCAQRTCATSLCLRLTAQVRSLRCLSLLQLPNKGVSATMLLAEHMASERLLVPRAHFQRLHTWRQFTSALRTVPEALRQARLSYNKITLLTIIYHE